VNVCWCTPSGGGCSGGRVTGVVSVATHDVSPGHAGLIAGLAQQACGAVVSNLDLVSVCPAVPDLVPSRFIVASVGGVDMGFCHWGGSCWCGRGWDSGDAHSCNGELDVGDGIGERWIGGRKVLDGGVLLNCCVCQIIERRTHLLCLFKFGGLVHAKCCVSGSHSIDVMYFGKGGGPMGLPVGPSVVGKRAMLPLAPGQCHVAAR
jgi:hypothetical protein